MAIKKCIIFEIKDSVNSKWDLQNVYGNGVIVANFPVIMWLKYDMIILFLKGGPV